MEGNFTVAIVGTGKDLKEQRVEAAVAQVWDFCNAFAAFWPCSDLESMARAAQRSHACHLLIHSCQVAWPLGKHLPALKAASTIFSFALEDTRDVYYILILPTGGLTAC